MLEDLEIADEKNEENDAEKRRLKFENNLENDGNSSIASIKIPDDKNQTSLFDSLQKLDQSQETNKKRGRKSAGIESNATGNPSNKNQKKKEEEREVL
jgi:hypothetical protein